MLPILPAPVLATFKLAASEAIKRYQADRVRIGQEALQRQISRGRPWLITDDAAAAMAVRYLRAITEGVARQNLELLAEALVSAASEPTFQPDEFKRHADRLEELTREEIFALAAVIRAKRATSADDRVGRYNAIVREAILTGLFADEDAVDDVLSALTRTGWIAAKSGFSFFGYLPTPSLDGVERLVDFDAVI